MSGIIRPCRAGPVVRFRPVLLVLAAVGLGSPAGASRAAVGFNFSANRTDDRAAPVDPAEVNPLAAADVAGAPGYRHANWNNLASDWNGVAGAVPSPLVDHLGQPVNGLSVAYDAPNTWDTGSAPSTADGWMMRNYLDSSPTVPGQPYLRIDGIRYHKYSVVVYADGDSANGRIARYWITDDGGADLTPNRFLNDTANFTGTYIRVGNYATNPAAVASGNYMVFDGLTSRTIRVRTEGVAGPALRAPLNAVQIIPVEVAPENGATVLSPVAGFNTLTVTIRAQGTLQADLGWLGVHNIPIDSSDSETAQLAGTQPVHLEAFFDPITHQGTVAGLEFFGGDVNVTNTMNFNLDLGYYLIVDLGNVLINGSNIGGRVDTPWPLSRVTGGFFPLADHDLVLDEGTLGGSATGLAANYLQPFNINLATTPVQGPLGAGSGAVTLSNPVVAGTTATYTVTVEIPVNFSDLVMDDDPVDVTLTATGTLRWQGTLTRQLPDWDGDGIIDPLDPDDDNDRLPDAWETAFALDPWHDLEANLDPDLDSFTTYQEYVADTHPLSGGSHLWLRIESTADPAVRALEFPSSSNRLYRMESSDDLPDGAWNPDGASVPGAGGLMVLNRTNAGSRAFYRVRVSLP